MLPHLGRRVLAPAVIAAALLAAAPTASADLPPTSLPLAQAQQDDGGRSYRPRSTKRLVKIAIFGGVAAIGVGGWVLGKMRGE